MGQDLRFCGHSTKNKLSISRFFVVRLVLPFFIIYIGSILAIHNLYLQSLLNREDVHIETHLESFQKNKTKIRDEVRPQPQNLADVVEETVRLLFVNNQTRAEAYLLKYPWSTFKFYVYSDDDIPKEYTWKYSAKCLNDRKAYHECDWGESICGLTGNETTATYSKRRWNRNADLILAKAFEQYEGDMRTYNATEADLFVVPYPSQAHRQCKVIYRRKSLGKNLFHSMERDLFPHLIYMNESTKYKHLFFASTIDKMQEILTLPLLAFLGDISDQCKFGKNCGTRVIPYANTNKEYQPNMVQHNFIKSINERQYSVAAKLNTKISGDGSMRQEFFNEIQRLQNKAPSEELYIGGKPVAVSEIKSRGRNMGNEREVMDIYRDSIFCVSLRGDAPPSKRLFDSILSGCIPVVLKYDESSEKGYVSHFAHRSTSIRLYYPFIQGTFFGDMDMGIDYSNFIVGVNGTCGPTCILPYLDDLLTNHKDTVQEMHNQLRRIAPLFSYGMQNNILKYPDAISSLLVQARHFVNHYTPYQTNK